MIVDSHLDSHGAVQMGRIAGVEVINGSQWLPFRVLTGRGADLILIDDPLKPDEALSNAQRKTANDWFSHTLYSRLNDKRSGAIVIIMQRLHEDDLVGHVLAQEPWEVVRFPAIAEADEVHQIETIWEPRTYTRR